MSRSPVANGVSEDGALVIGTRRSLPAGGAGAVATCRARRAMRFAAPRSVGSALIVAADDDVGVLYGVFHLLRLLQTRQPLERLELQEVPAVQLRVLNHWDNLDRSVERGYAGQSIWDWHKLPDYIDPRYVDYARANASLGINGTVLTNVNSNAVSLRPDYLEKAAALAGVLRPYGIRVFLTVWFAAPIEIGGLQTADPADPAVKQWWQAKAAEIYRLIPDFGGFLVKANSKASPVRRTTADRTPTARTCSPAVAPFGGVVMWRAFVYSNERPDDRAKQAYSEFKPLDGRFRDNVLVQVKNGLIDFQPREPFHPLFGAMPRTPLMLEVQITKEYLGFATHLVYLGTLYEEVLRADTYVRAPGLMVAKVIDGIAGVAGHRHRSQLERLALRSGQLVCVRAARGSRVFAEDIARDWVRMTFTNDATFVTRVVDMMMSSRQAVVDYMTPLGLHHLMAEGHHYGPQPWFDGGKRADWTPVYFHRADAGGIGFDRSASGSNAVRQYAKHRSRTVRRSAACTRRLPVVVSSRAVELSHAVRPPALGRARVSLHAWSGCRSRDAQDLGRTSDRRRRASRSGRGVPADPGGGGEVVARRVRRVFPIDLAAADSVGPAIAGASARLLQGAVSCMHPATRLCVLACSGVAGAANAATLLHPVFQDHVVLQRDKPINVWGEALPREA